MRTAATVAIMVSLFLGAAIMAGCSSAPTIQESPGSVVLVPDRTYRQVWVAGLRVMSKNFDIKTLDEAGGYLKGDQGLWGPTEAVHLQITPAAGGAPPFRVRVVSTVNDRAFKNWEKEIADEVRSQLKLPAPKAKSKKNEPALKGEKKPLFKEGKGSPDD